MSGLRTIFSGPPKPPAPAEPVPMPDLFDPAILRAQRRVLERASGGSGRASTVLSGSDAYSGTKLGTP